MRDKSRPSTAPSIGWYKDHGKGNRIRRTPRGPPLDPWEQWSTPMRLDLLRCPVDHSRLRPDASRGGLVSSAGRFYPVIEGVPVMLTSERPDQLRSDELAFTRRAIEDANAGRVVELPDHLKPGSELMAFVRAWVARTSGLLYVGDAATRMRKPPIPRLTMPCPGQEGMKPAALLLDIGSGWGRWSIAAAQAGYQVIGLDPRLESTVMSKRLAESMGVEVLFVCGDALALPFADGAFDAVWSYSVLQHFSVEGLKMAVREVARALTPEGLFRTQMLNSGGIRSRQYLRARGSRTVLKPFEPPYFSVDEMARIFGADFEDVRISVDQFFTQAQVTDWSLFSLRSKAIVAASMVATAIGKMIPGSVRWSDNVFVSSRKPRQAYDSAVGASNLSTSRYDGDSLSK